MINALWALSTPVLQSTPNPPARQSNSAGIDRKIAILRRQEAIWLRFKRRNRESVSFQLREERKILITGD